MSWDTMPHDVARFALQLAAVKETELTGQSLLAIHGALENTWRRKRTMTSDVPIPIPPPRGTGLHPQRCEVAEADMRFEFSLGNNIADAKLPAVAQFQVRVVGAAAYEHCIVELEDHWRVDTHEFAGTPREPHPLIHFQRGGHSQDAWAGKANYVPGPALPGKAGDYWQALLQSPGPRIPFPPLCPILAIDFVIGQHDGDVWNHLRSVPEYREIIATSQGRLWNPFFESLTEDGPRRRWLGPLLL